MWQQSSPVCRYFNAVPNSADAIDVHSHLEASDAAESKRCLNDPGKPDCIVPDG